MIERVKKWEKIGIHITIRWLGDRCVNGYSVRVNDNKNGNIIGEECIRTFEDSLKTALKFCEELYEKRKQKEKRDEQLRIIGLKTVGEL